MQTNKREDIHRPSAITPEDYIFIAYEYLPGAGAGELGALRFLEIEREKIRRHMEQTGGTYSNHEHGGNCMVCGSVNAIYTCLFYHAKSNSYVRTGLDCAQKMQMDDGRGNLFKKAVSDAREAQAGKRKAQAALTDHNLTGAWGIYIAEDRAGFERDEFTVSDIVGKLVKYGSISEAQYNFLRVLVDRVSTKDERKAEYLAKRAAENAVAKDCPNGRIDIEGEIVSTKWQDSDFGGALKMLVKVKDGYKVWGTAPGALGDDLKGKRIAFRATVTPSKDDTKFGFFSRPTGAQLAETAAVI